MDISQLRANIDKIDGELTALFQKRMETAAEIAKYKQENSLPVFDRERERDILNAVTADVPDEIQGYTKTLYQTIFDLSRSYQKKLIKPQSSLSKKLEKAGTPIIFELSNEQGCANRIIRLEFKTIHK